MTSTRPIIPPQILWPSLVIVLLGASLTVCGLTVFFAVSDPSFAVEENYYEKALNWDDQAAQRRTNEGLGWMASAQMSDESPRGQRTITITLRDKDAQPIENATIIAAVFHPARSADRLSTTFEYREGVYVASGRFARKGDWRAHGIVTLGDTIFTFQCTVEHAKGGG